MTTALTGLRFCHLRQERILGFFNCPEQHPWFGNLLGNLKNLEPAVTEEEARAILARIKTGLAATEDFGPEGSAAPGEVESEGFPLSLRESACFARIVSGLDEEGSGYFRSPAEEPEQVPRFSKKWFKVVFDDPETLVAATEGRFLNLRLAPAFFSGLVSAHLLQRLKKVDRLYGYLKSRSEAGQPDAKPAGLILDLHETRPTVSPLFDANNRPIESPVARTRRPALNELQREGNLDFELYAEALIRAVAEAKAAQVDLAIVPQFTTLLT